MDNNQNIFWNSLLKHSFVVGIVMLLSKITETALLLNSNKYSLIFLECIVVFAAFLFMLIHFTKQYRKKVLDAMAEPKEFTFGRGFNYILMICIIASIIISFGSYIYIHKIVGYENYINGILTTTKQYLASVPNASGAGHSIEKMFEVVRSAPKPGILREIWSGICSYAFYGAFWGLILSGALRKGVSLSKANDDDDDI